MQERKLHFLAGVGISGGLIILVTWWVLHSNSIEFKFLTPSYIKETIGAFGIWSFVIYTAVYIINTILIFPPNAPISLSAGLLFGPVWGAVMIMISALISTSIAFFIARSIEQKFLHKYIHGKWDDVFQQVSQKGFIAVFSLRMIPIVPYEIFNYLCGLSNIRFRDFFLGTFFGMLPGAIVTAFLGGKLAEVENFKDLFSMKTFIALGFMVMLIVFLIIVFLFYKRSLAVKR